MNMPKVKAILLTNVAAVDSEISITNFINSQQIVNDPMVIFYHEETDEILKSYKIVATDIGDLEFMYREKVFYTSSIPEGEVEICYGTVFWGVNQISKEGNRSVI